MAFVASRISSLSGRGRARSRSLRVYAVGAASAAIALPLCGVFFWLAEHGHNEQVPTLGAAFVWLIRTLLEQQSGTEIHTLGGYGAYLLVVLSGVVLVGSGTGAVASQLIDRAQDRRLGIVKSANGRDHFVLCGWNAHGEELVREILEGREPGGPEREVVILDMAEKNPLRDVRDLTDHVKYISGNPRERRDLEKANVAHARAVIVLAEDQGLAVDKRVEIQTDAITLLTALKVRGLRSDQNHPYITAEVLGSESVSHFEENNIAYVAHAAILPALLARDASEGGVFEAVRELVSVKGMDLYVDPAPTHLVGVAFAEALAAVKAGFDATLLGVVSAGDGRAALNPGTDRVIAANDRIVYVAGDQVNWESSQPT